MAENPPRIPSMNELLAAAEERGTVAAWGREASREAIAAALEEVRARRRAGETAAGVDEAFWLRVEAHLAVLPAMEMAPALNATGVVLHTNLGRAPWPAEAREAAAAACSAAVCEIDRESGQRGRRDAAVSRLLAKVTGAEAGLPVNNNAATVLLAVSALARGRKVVVARPELVEIGGSYRMPEVIAAGGAEMVAVGTTNRAHLKDFAAALEDPEVSCVLRVHPSNYRIVGFAGMPPMDELAALCREHGQPLVEDLGSGVIHGQELQGLEQEHPVRRSLEAGCDLVTFSGDKLLGGPQAGLIVGAQALVEKLRRDMLTRCLRLDKTLLAALEAVLRVHALGPEAALARIPALTRIAWGPAELEPRAQALAAKLAAALPASAGWELAVVPTAGRVGSGASPVEDLPGAGLRLACADRDPEDLARHLRMRPLPVFTRVQDEALLVDLRAIAAEDDAALAEALASLGA
jgi:L-seryl-tRNA(Ser) seleniumtransferase